MSNVKISGLPAATTPLAGTEVLPIVQSGQTKQVSVNNLTTGKTVSATQYTSTIATGTAPLVVASTTEVTNLRSANATSADTANQVKSNATTGVLQVAGPGTGTTRVMTTPDANFTVARTDAANSFTGNQTFDSGTLFVDSANDIVSIGSTSPAAVTVKLIVTGTAGVTAVSGILLNDTASRQYAIYNDGALHLYDATATADRLVVSSAGNVTVNTGNLIIGTSGKGIDFSATPGTGTSELLNDYEEGTWTATLTNISGGTVTNTNYVKVGRLVTARLSISGGTYVANSSFFSLPFSCVALTSGTFSNATIRGGFLEAQASSSCYFSTSDSGNVHCTITYITS
jgi:hypothetical protein